MSRLKWNIPKGHTYETGIDRGVLFLRNPDGTYSRGVAWNGLTAVTINPSGGKATALWADDKKYLNLLSAEDLGFTIEAYSYPRAFKPCLGRYELMDGVTIAQQKRQMFGFSFRTLVGNAEGGNGYSYKLHIIYGCMASPSERAYSTINDSPGAVKLSWDVTTLPIVVEGYKPTAEVIIDEAKFKKLGLMNVLQAIEDILYGTDETEPRIPDLEELPKLYVRYRYIRDSDEDVILDSEGKPLLSAVYIYN